VPSKPGLNHLAFEIDTEAELVDFYHKIKNAPDIKIDMVLDHGLAKSVYVIDPGGSELSSMRIQFTTGDRSGMKRLQGTLS